MSDENQSDPKKFGPDWAKKFSQDLHDEIHQRIHIHINAAGRNRAATGVSWRNGSLTGGVVLGGILILVGLAFLLDHLGYIDIGRIWRFWPLLLVFAGISHVFSSERRFWGLLLILFGTFLQLNQLGIAHFGWAMFWPVLLIAAGLMVMWNSLIARKATGTWSGLGQGDPRTTVNGAAVFSGLERRVTTQDFQGGSVTAIFGGIELDLTDANMQADEATLEINCVFGGAEVRVPDSWIVAFRGAPVFGGVEDKTRLRHSGDTGDSRHKVLNIIGTVVFGGLEIKN